MADNESPLDDIDTPSAPSNGNEEETSDVFSLIITFVIILALIFGGIYWYKKFFRHEINVPAAVNALENTQQQTNP